MHPMVIFEALRITGGKTGFGSSSLSSLFTGSKNSPSGDKLYSLKLYQQGPEKWWVGDDPASFGGFGQIGRGELLVLQRCMCQFESTGFCVGMVALAISETIVEFWTGENS